MPDLVATAMAAPAARPYSADVMFVCTWIALAAGVGSGPPKNPANSASTHSVNFPPSSTGSPIVTRNMSVGNRIANSDTRSHSPLGASSSSNSLQRWYTCSSIRRTAARETTG